MSLIIGYNGPSLAAYSMIISPGIAAAFESDWLLADLHSQHPYA